MKILIIDDRAYGVSDAIFEAFEAIEKIEPEHLTAEEINIRSAMVDCIVSMVEPMAGKNEVLTVVW